MTSHTLQDHIEGMHTAWEALYAATDAFNTLV